MLPVGGKLQREVENEVSGSTGHDDSGTECFQTPGHPGAAGSRRVRNWLRAMRRPGPGTWVLWLIGGIVFSLAVIVWEHREVRRLRQLLGS